MSRKLKKNSLKISDENATFKQKTINEIFQKHGFGVQNKEEFSVVCRAK